VLLDSIETERYKKRIGEEVFYTVADDQMYYHYDVIQRLDSLNIPVKYSQRDSIIIRAPHFYKLIVKNPSFSIYNYFYYNGGIYKR